MDKYIKYEDIQECRFFQDERGEWILHADIIKIPAADVAPIVHGYWIEGEKTYRHNWGSITVHQCNCSQCGYTQESSIWGGGISDSIKKTKYCPNCGAKMDGE